MPNRYSTETVLANCERLARVWTDNPTFSLGEVTLTGFQSLIAEVRQKREQLEALRMQEVALSNDLSQKTAMLAAIRTRGLSGLRAVFGPNSTQYEQGGGKRQDDIRRAPRKGAAADPGASS